MNVKSRITYDPKLNVINQLQLVMSEEWWGDIKIFLLKSNNVWQSKFIFLYLINAVKFEFSSSILYGFLKSINIDIPELDIDFKSLLYDCPYTSPIFMCCSFGPSWIWSLFSQYLILKNDNKITKHGKCNLIL